MKRLDRAKKISNRISQLLKRNPEIKKALKIFDISYKHYARATNDVVYYTDTSTSKK